MAVKIFAGIVAVALTLAYLAPPVFKLKDPALAIVVVLGIVLIAIDLWQSLQSKDD